MTYAEVILPLPLSGTFTYAVPDEMSSHVRAGSRAIVPFGRKKFYTAIVRQPNVAPPKGIEIKEISSLLDGDVPILRRPQMQLWEWMAEYYLCSVGEVMKAALPSGLKVESETWIECNSEYEPADTDAPLSEREARIVMLLQHEGKRMSVGDVEKTTGYKNVAAVISRLLARGAVMISEKLVERYRARRVSYVSLEADRADEHRLHAIFDEVHRAKKQESVLLALLELSSFMRRDSPVQEVTLADLLERSGATRPIVSAMEKKGLLRVYTKEINRFRIEVQNIKPLPTLSESQTTALRQIHDSWRGGRDITLLRGVTASGKTEIYMHLIDDALRLGRQALFLVPEIALTTQLTTRLQNVFGPQVVIYHSKFSDNERVDIWKRLLTDSKPCVVIGARSAIFLPFADLGLVIVDEEHESSYKQENPAPRYNARDTAMVLARMHGAKVLLATATPSVESYWKALAGKFGLVELTERYGRDATLPEIVVIDMLKDRQKGEMSGALALQTKKMITGAVSDGRQAIVFLNRRGYAPVAECRICAFIAKCDNCDVSLTYHRNIDRMVCHYCGAQYPVPKICPSCHEPSIEIYGYGTERIEGEIEQAFPEAAVVRMDLDTTRNKDGYETIINDFSSGKHSILVGTQMVTKGLDFSNVSVVAVVNADNLLNMPDFRASERAFNMLEQVAGRAGRRSADGVVAIQTRQTSSPLFPFILAHDYTGFYNYEIEERRRYNYPPFTRLIYIYLRHRDRRALDGLAVEYTRRLHSLFGNRVFGPEEPAVSRVQSLYIRKIMLKIEVNASMQKVKQILRNLYCQVMTSDMWGVKGLAIAYDVDPY